MNKLEEIIEKIAALKDISKDSSTGLREYHLSQGSGFSSTIYQSEKSAVAVAFFSAGTIFPYHEHKSKEILVVFQGRVSVISDNGNTTLESGQSITMEAGYGHMLRVHEDLKMFVITIPPDFDAVAKIIK